MKEFDFFKEYYKDRCSWNVEIAVQDKYEEIGRGEIRQCFELVMVIYLWYIFGMYVKCDEKLVQSVLEGSNLIIL